MTGRKQQVYLAAGALAAVGACAGLAALLGNERIALLGLLVITTFLAVVAISTFSRVTNGLRLLAKARAEAVGSGQTGSAPGSAREELAERRLLALLEAERLRADDRHRELVSAIEAIAERQATALSVVGKDVLRVRSDGRRSRHDESRAVEALLQLQDRAAFRAPMPPAGKWALEPRGILELLALVDERSPSKVVELGSGTSTVWLGYALEKSAGSLISIDHDPAFADITRWNVERHGLDASVEVRDAPLAPWDGPGSNDWYSTELLADVDAIDLLLVDGPPEGTAHEARYPALPVLFSKLSPGAIVVLDDTDREDEQRVIEKWLEQHPELSRRRGDYGRMTVLQVAG